MRDPRTSINTEQQIGAILSSFGRSLETVTWDSVEAIEQGQWRAFRQSDGWVQFDGLGPCLGILVHLEQSRVTLGCHFADPEGYDSPKLTEFLSCLEAIGLAQKKVQVYLAGFSVVLDSDRDRGFVNVFRTKVSSDFLKQGVDGNCIFCHWADDENIVDISLNLKTGHAEMESIEPPDDDNWS